jgi:hypothetical protein
MEHEPMPAFGRARARLLGACFLCVSPVLVSGLRGADAPRAVDAGPVIEVDTAQELRFSLDIPAVNWRPAAPGTDGEPRWEALLEGYATAGLPAKPRVPRDGGFLLVAPGMRPVLDVVRESWETVAPRQLAIEPIPILRGDPQSDEVFASEFTPTPGKRLPLESIPETVQEDLALPPVAIVGMPAVTLGEPGWWRGRRVVSYAVSPVQVDGQGRAVRTLSNGTWRVRFVPDAEFAKAALPVEAQSRLVGSGDQRFGFLFLNGGSLSSWPTEAAARGVARDEVPAAVKALRGAARGTPLGYPEVRLPVPRTQLYRVRAQQLRDNGLLPNEPIQEGQIRLYQRRYYGLLDDPTDDQGAPYVEVEVPIQMDGEGDLFDGDDEFVFWGLRPRDDTAFTAEIAGEEISLTDCGDAKELNNDYNVYWLQLADPDQGENWARMGTATPFPAAEGSPLPSYRRQDYYEEALAYRENVPSIAVDRAYFNSYLATQVNVSLSLWSPVPGQTGGSLGIGIAGFSGSERTITSNLVGAGGTYALPSFIVNSVYEATRTLPLPPAALVETAVSLRLEAPTNPAGRLYSFLNWVRIEYDARFVAVDGRLQFNGGSEAAANDLEVTGFTTNDVSLFEVTDARVPLRVVLAPDNVVGADGQYRLSLQVDQSAGMRTFYAVSNTGGDGIADIRYFDATLATNPIVPTQLAGVEADLLVVCHPDFREAAQRWIDHRRARAGVEGLTIQVVSPQDLYDWYSGGLKNPWAIKRFCNHAISSPDWNTWALMLIGDANENARELGVTGDFVAYSGDYVPTHHHLQTTSQYLPEVLASDKWYVYPSAGDFNFPGGVATPWEMYVGRLPCNSVEQLNRMIDKIMLVENVQPGESWRRRSLFFADDEYSFGEYGDSGGTALIFRLEELKFRQSERDSCAVRWRSNGAMVPLVADTLMLHNAMQDLYGNDPYLPSQAYAHCAAVATPQLLAALNAGGLLAHYQGHGNAVVMTHEHWFVDDRRGEGLRHDVDALTNVGKPWMYFGMGCHLADWAQYTIDQSGVPKNSLAEKFLGWTAAGAYACYGSSGYEYLTPNFDFSNVMMRRWMMRPPYQTVEGGGIASRWVLGELMWASEADILAINPGASYRSMVSQYTLLGDPLMVLDCGAPIIAATLDGTPISGQVSLEAIDASNQRVVLLQARDEAGIAGLQVLDSTGADLTEAVVTEETVHHVNNRQIVDYVLTLPVRPFDHQITVHVRDTADRLSTDDHTTLVFDVEHTYEFMATVAGGDPVVIDPNTFVFTPGVPVAISGVISTSSFVSPGSDIHLTGEGLTVTDVTVEVSRTSDLSLSFTAEALADAVPPRSVVLTIDGYATSYLLEAGEGTGGVVTLRDVMNYPNPMREETRFVMRTNLSGGQGRIQVYTVSGRLVAVVPFAVASADVVVPWDGRDREGDRIANGVYLYRVQVEGAAGQARSDMQRLVVMR